MSTDDAIAALGFTREDWTRLAACRGAGVALFFTERGESTAGAKAVCAGCPVKAECLDYALRTGQYIGIWGGTSERERRQMRRQMRSASPKPEPPHGAMGRYNRGCRCEDCAAANRARVRRYQVAGRVA